MAAINAGFGPTLAVIGMLASVVGVLFLEIVKYMYFDEAGGSSPDRSRSGGK